MNILFVYTSEIIPENGGVQRVTSVLKNYFEKKHNKVFCLSLKKDSEQKSSNIDQFFLPYADHLYHKENISFFINFIKQQQIDIVINQAALGGTLSKFCAFAKRVSNVKVISVIHNSLLGNVYNFTSSHEKLLNKIPIPFLRGILETKFFKKLLLIAYITKYKRRYTYTCESSDQIVLLSNKFRDELKKFVPNCDSSKIVAISNPCTINLDGTVFKKQNELLYVGRINTVQKKVDLLLKIWGEIYLRHPDWNLSILGDGEEKNHLEKESIKLGLERVQFYGIQNPIPFYKKAKIFCMTSSYEGFGLVLVESQLFGTIPFAFDSFASVSDIITDNENGVLIEPFNIEKYSNRLSELMINEEKMKVMALNCQKSVDKFSIDSVGELWIELFIKLNNNV